LCANIFKTPIKGNLLAELQQALETVEANSGLARKLNDARRNGIIESDNEPDLIAAARDAGVLSDDEAVKLLEQDRLVMEIIHVDDFAPGEIARKPARTSRKRTRKKVTKASRKAAKPADEAP
jgi:hypothetical protein